jgi:hypothetical protein
MWMLFGLVDDVNPDCAGAVSKSTSGYGDLGAAALLVYVDISPALLIYAYESAFSRGWSGGCVIAPRLPLFDSFSD